MAANGADKAGGPTKSFMTVGPTLHYSHSNVIRCWWLAVAVYIATCLFWSRILTGTALKLDSFGDVALNAVRLGDYVVSPISIYQYPWQILVLGLLMGVLAVGPVLVSQLLSFRYSLPMILATALICRLDVFAGLLLVSCIAVACRPLRFRSRFISIVLCMAPQMVYWAICGSARGVDPIRWGFSFAPWICAWLVSLAIAGAVLGTGHYTRYKPGLVFSVTGLVLAVAAFVFFTRISFAELDYQLYIAKNNPEEVEEFHDRSMTEVIDLAIADPSIQSYLKGLFYPTEPILLRKDLKTEIQKELDHDRWPRWLVDILPDEFNYQARRQWLGEQYDLFINKWPNSRRMPIALYYKAMLEEYRPDTQLFGESPREVLHFYSDYPHHETRAIWFKLFQKFPDSLESLEARWRLAVNLAGRGAFVQALQLCRDAKDRLRKELKRLDGLEPAGEGFLTAFAAPPDTVMTPSKLLELKMRLDEFEVLISEQNHENDDASKDRLARFVQLNPYSRDYAAELDALLSEMEPDDPLMDNVLLAKLMLVSDSHRKATELKALGSRFAGKDGGIRALYELGRLKVKQWKDSEAGSDEKKRHLSEARGILTNFINLYPESIFSEQARILLDSLPGSE